MRPHSSKKESSKKEVSLERNSDNFIQEFELLMANKIFAHDLSLIKTKWTNSLPIKNDVPKLIKKYKLSEKYEWPLMIYLTGRPLKKSDSPRGIDLIFEKDMKSASIKIYPYSTLEDVKKAYSYIIKQIKPSKVPRSRKADQQKRDLYIYEKRKSGLGVQEIVSLVNKELGQNLREENIREIIKKMEIRIKSKANR